MLSIPHTNFEVLRSYPSEDMTHFVCLHLSACDPDLFLWPWNWRTDKSNAYFRFPTGAGHKKTRRQCHGGRGLDVERDCTRDQD